MVIPSNRVLKVNFQNHHSESVIQNIKVWVKKNFSPNQLRLIKPFVERIFPSAKTTIHVLIKNQPNTVISRKFDDPVSILSLNLWHDWPRHRFIHQRMDRLVKLVRDEQVDIILTQELARTTNIVADEWLSNELGMAYVFSRANGDSNSIGFEEGLAIFSRFPIHKPRVAQLSSQNLPLVRRIALGVTIDAPQGEFLAFNVHLGVNGRQNEVQLNRLMDWVEKESSCTPAVIGGDFNAGEHTSQIQSTRQIWQDSYRLVNSSDEGFTHRIKWPWGRDLLKSRLDYLFMKREANPWTIIEASHLEVDDCFLSDHKPVLVRMRVT